MGARCFACGAPEAIRWDVGEPSQSFTLCPPCAERAKARPEGSYRRTGPQGAAEAAWPSVADWKVPKEEFYGLAVRLLESEPRARKALGFSWGDAPGDWAPPAKGCLRCGKLPTVARRLCRSCYDHIDHIGGEMPPIKEAHQENRGRCPCGRAARVKGLCRQHYSRDWNRRARARAKADRKGNGVKP